MDRWKLEAEIKRQGYTLSDFAEKVNIDRSTLWRKLTGASEFTVSEVARICNALEIKDPRDYFFTTQVADKQNIEE